MCGIVLIVHFENITIWQSFLILGMYAAYIIASLLIHYVGMWLGKKKEPISAIGTPDQPNPLLTPSGDSGDLTTNIQELSSDGTRISLLESVTALDDLGDEKNDYRTFPRWIGLFVSYNTKLQNDGEENQLLKKSSM